MAPFLFLLLIRTSLCIRMAGKVPNLKQRMKKIAINFFSNAPAFLFHLRNTLSGLLFSFHDS